MNFKLIALISIGLNVAGFLFVIGKRYYFSHSAPAIDPQLAYFDMWDGCRKSVLEPLGIDSGDVIFVGNSLTEGFPLAEMFGSTRFKNRGISGNRSSHILARIGAIAAARPAKIFLDVGINDILNGIPIDTLRRNYMAIVDTISALAPHTQVIVQTILPLGPSHKAKEPIVELFNDWLKVYCQQKKIACIDLFPAFLKGDLLAPEYTMDDIHLTGKGYAVWAQKVKGYL